MDVLELIVLVRVLDIKRMGKSIPEVMAGA